MNNTKKQVAKKSPTPITATVTDVQQSLAVLDSTVTKASADAAVANTAISNATKPMTIGN